MSETASAINFVNLILQAQITIDADTGKPWLIAAGNTADDWDDTTPDKLRAMAADARQQLDQIEALAARYEAITAIQELVDKHHIRLMEMPRAEFGDLGERLCGWYGVLDGDRVLVFPDEQDPVERLKLARFFIDHAAAKA
ncbi:hypothetical protein JBE04_08240 [Streptomyces sp. PRKS01-29]|nr:hypothetical protein [Streptomyces sabulosicollis]MBI0294470.1 hypothetical protein [Streptomyces sabulosicollis]